MTGRFFPAFVFHWPAPACSPSVGSWAEVGLEDELLRRSYDSAVTRAERDYLVYIPAAYEQDVDKKWPVILFLHGNGERGDGKEDLDFVMAHGPLREAWILRRDLPFIVISPQLPVFGESEAIAGRSKAKPARLDRGVPERNYGFPSELPIQRTDAEKFPKGIHSSYEPFSETTSLPAGWDRIDEELIGILDAVLGEFRADPHKVYLTGLSMGGFGTFHMAANYPKRWAAVAPVVGVGKLEDAKIIADAKLPIWMFGGGKDTIVKPHWLYQMARALEDAGHPALRFTVHEDMDHDAWKRVYEGQDLFNWLLRFKNNERPQPEKKAQ